MTSMPMKKKPTTLKQIADRKDKVEVGGEVKKTTKMQPKPKSPAVDKANDLIKRVAAAKVKDDNELTVATVATENGMDPKVARAKLRRLGKVSNEGRWPTVQRDSKAHKDLIATLKGTVEKKEDKE